MMINEFEKMAIVLEEHNCICSVRVNSDGYLDKNLLTIVYEELQSKSKCGGQTISQQ